MIIENSFFSQNACSSRLVFHDEYFANLTAITVIQICQLMWFCLSLHVLLYARLLYATSGSNWQNIKQVLSNSLRLNLFYLKIIHILHPRYPPKIIGQILKNKQKNKYVCIHEIIRLMKMMKMKNSSHRYEINRPRSRHGQYFL